MFPYERRWRWFFHSPPDHLLAAIQRRPDMAGHPLVEARAGQMRRYMLVRAFVAILLYAGLAATILTSLAHVLPLTDAVARAWTEFAATVGALTGIVTLSYIFLSRLILQCQMDILGHFMLGMPYQR